MTHLRSRPGARDAIAEWGRISVQAQRRGRPRPVNDTWIAACCLVHGLPLATFNMKDYTDFAEHEGLQILGYNDH
jgi:toxin FitB